MKSASIKYVLWPSIAILSAIFITLFLVKTELGRSIRASVGPEPWGACYKRDGSCQDLVLEKNCKTTYEEFNKTDRDYWAGSNTRCNKDYIGIISGYHGSTDKEVEKTVMEFEKKCAESVLANAKLKCENPALVYPYSIVYPFKILEREVRPYSEKEDETFTWIKVICGIVIKCNKPDATPTPTKTSSPTPTTSFYR